MCRVMGPEIFRRVYPDWSTGQAQAVESVCRAEGNRVWVAVGLTLVSLAVEEIGKLGIPLAEIGTGGDPGHAAARRVYEKAGFTALPLVRYYKALPGHTG